LRFAPLALPARVTLASKTNVASKPANVYFFLRLVFRFVFFAVFFAFAFFAMLPS